MLITRSLLARLSFALLVALGLSLFPTTPAAAQTAQRCFAETGQCIEGSIRAYWERNGGLAVFGFPTTSMAVENVEGLSLTVQWFERDRLEIQPDGRVTAGRLGARLLELRGTPWQYGPSEPTEPGCLAFGETGYRTCGLFASYWQANGGLERFGYPITAPFETQIEGLSLTVQYFERRRFELHTGNTVLLGLLGNEVRALQDGAVVGPDAYEPDDTREQARSIALNEVQNRTFHRAGDVDWVRFEAQAGQTYRFEGFDLSAGTDTVFELYDQTGSQVGYNDDAVGVASRIDFLPTNSGPLFLLVRQFSSEFYEGGQSYRLRVTLTPTFTPDAYEPDDTREQARPIALDEVQDRSFHRAGDIDWVRFEARNGLSYRFESFDLGPETDTVFTLYNAVGEQIAYNDDAGSVASRITYSATSDGSLFLRVSQFGETFFNDIQPYRLRVSISPVFVPDAYEPDDTREQARPIALNEVQDRSFHRAGDVDWVRFEAQAGVLYHFDAFELSSNTYPVFELFDASGSPIAYSDRFVNNGVRLPYTPVNTGPLFLAVRSISDATFDQRETYRLRVTIAPPSVPDAYEPDDTREQARPIALNETQNRTFHRADDVDWVRFEAQAGITYRFESFELGEYTDTVFELYNAAGNPIAYNDDFDGLASRIDYAATVSGPVFLRVSRLSTDYFEEIEPYRLRVRNLP